MMFILIIGVKLFKNATLIFEIVHFERFMSTIK